MTFRTKLGIAFSTVLALTVMVAMAGWFGMATALRGQEQLFHSTERLRSALHRLEMEEKAYLATGAHAHAQAVFAAIGDIRAANRSSLLMPVEERKLDWQEQTEVAIATYKTSFERYVQQTIHRQTMRCRMLRESERLVVNTSALDRLGIETEPLTRHMTHLQLAEKEYILAPTTRVPPPIRSAIRFIVEECLRIRKESTTETQRLRAFRISNVARAYERSFQGYVAAYVKRQAAHRDMRQASDGCQKELTAYIQAETHRVRQRIQWLQSALAVASALAILLGIVATLLLSSLISRPLRQLRASAERIVQGDLDTRVGIESADDVGDLARSFDLMVTRLKDSFAELESKNRTLQEALEAGKQSELRYRTLFESNRDAIMVVNSTYHIVNINEATIDLFSGTNDGEFMGRTPLDLSPSVQADGVPTQDAAQVVFSKAVEKGAHLFEWTYQRLDGTPILCSVFLNQLVIDGEQHFLGTIRDIGERKRIEAELASHREHLEDLVRERTQALSQAQEELRHAEKMRAIGQLAGGVAHDFNNHLAGIMGCAELLRSRLTEEKHIGYTDTILHVANRSADLVAQLLAFARKGKMLSVPVDIHALIGDVVRLLQHSIDRKINIRQILGANPSLTRGDPSQLQSALLNVALNARDAMPDGGTFTITTETRTLSDSGRKGAPADLAPGAYLVISLADTGTGMDEDTRQHIFEPFFTTKTVGQGTGMGLSACYGTIRNHSGAVEVESSFGEGSRFVVWLPLLYIDDGETSDPIALVRPNRQARILLVDDDEMVRHTTAEILEELGYSVVTAADGAEAVAYYQAEGSGVDLVILDVIMPVMGGEETYHALKKINPEAKVILSSGYSQHGQAQAILDQGAQTFIQKPFRKARLSTVVAEVLS